LKNEDSSKEKREFNFSDWYDFFAVEGDLDFPWELIFADLSKNREIREI